MKKEKYLKPDTYVVSVGAESCFLHKTSWYDGTDKWSVNQGTPNNSDEQVEDDDEATAKKNSWGTLWD